MTRTSCSMYASAMALSYTLLVPFTASAQQTATLSPAPASPALVPANTSAAVPPAPGATTPATPAAAQSAQPAAQTVPTSSLPFTNRVNPALPTWLRFKGEFRERWEGFDGLGFNETREDYYWLSRFRFGAVVTPSKQLSFQVQVQDARVGKKTVGATGTPFRAPFDLRMAYGDIGATTGPATLRAGRQELAYGDQRLVGHVSWLNAARTFDGGKLTLRSKTVQVDTFVTSVVRIMEEEFDKSGNGNIFSGAYLTAGKLVPQGSLEPYVFWRQDTNLTGEAGATGELHQTTLGVRFAGKMPARLDYNIEMAMQRGSLAANDVSTWAGHWQLRESLPGPGTVKLTGEYNYATGDSDITDGTRETFDQLYPTPHDKYGLADQVGWRNIHHARAGLEFTPFKGWPITTNYHSWWLADKADALYNVAGAVIAPRVPGGAVNRHVGQELDVQVSKTLFPQLLIAAGYAHIFSGPFLSESTPGADFSHPYVMATYIFLAEK